MSSTEIKELVEVFRILKLWRDERETQLLASGQEQAVAAGASLN